MATPDQARIKADEVRASTKFPNKIEILPLEIRHYRDDNAGSLLKPVEKAKLIGVFRVLESGTVHRRLLMKVSFDAALKLVSWPLDLQKKLFVWNKTAKAWTVKKMSISTLEAISKLSHEDASKKLSQGGS